MAQLSELTDPLVMTRSVPVTHKHLGQVNACQSRFKGLYFQAELARIEVQTCELTCTCTLFSLFALLFFVMYIFLLSYMYVYVYV